VVTTKPITQPDVDELRRLAEEARHEAPGPEALVHDLVEKLTIDDKTIESSKLTAPKAIALANKLEALARW
jgi:hypothetical protein